MRIAIWHNLASGGAKRALYYHVRGLVDRGHEVECWCPSSADTSYLPLSRLAVEHVLPVDMGRSIADRVRERARLRTHIPRVMATIDAHCREAAAAIGDGFDVVLASSDQYLAVPPIARYLATPSVLYLQEPNRRLYEALEPLPSLDPSRVLRRDARRQARAEHASIRAFARVLVNSRFSRESVLRAYGVDATVCYLGIDTDLFAPISDPPRDYVVGLGSFSPTKNIELVLRAIGLVPEPRPPLVWIGNHATYTAYMERLRDLATSLGVAFTMRADVADDDLVTVIAGARTMVYAARLEPFGLAPLEANACGVPVVAIAEGGMRESICDEVNGLLVEPDPKSMAGAVRRLWQHPVDAAALGRSAREHVVKHWGIEDAVERLERELVQIADA